MNDIKLAAFRPADDMHPAGFKILEMTREEKASRRCFIRGLLKGTKWESLKNDQIDKIRMISSGDGWIIEDENLYQFVLR